MKKPIDYDNLGRVIEEGVKDACKDAGLTRFAISVQFQALVVVGEDSAQLIPEVHIEVTELTEEQSDALQKMAAKREGN